VGLVGLGQFGRLHALTLAGLAEVELVALVGRRAARLEALSAELPGVPGWLSLDAALAESGAEAWVVATSTASHVPIARAILSAGKSVLVEKPLASSLAEAEELASLLGPQPARLMLGHTVLFGTELRRLLHEVAVRPPLVHIACQRHRPMDTLRCYPGENPFHLTMVHDLYVVQALVGGREPVEFSAQVHRTPAGERDLALAQLRWEDGLLATFAASFLTPEGMPIDGYDRMELYGAGWAARLDPNPRPLTLWDDRARSPLTLEIWAEGDAPVGMLAEELRCFSRVVRGQQAIPLGARFQDGLQVLRWLERLEQAADRRPAPATG